MGRRKFTLERKLCCLKNCFADLDIIREGVANADGSSTHKRKVVVGWMRPQVPWLKVNVDGASKGAMSFGGAACLIKDGEGNWMKGAARNLGSCSSDQAELWGMLLGLELAWVEGTGGLL